MKKQTFIKGSLLLAIVSVITINVALCSNKNKQKLQLDSFNIEALTQNGDYKNDPMLGPNYEQKIALCDYTYSITYTINSGSIHINNLKVGANANYAFSPKSNIGGSAEYGGNWNNNNNGSMTYTIVGGQKMTDVKAFFCEKRTGYCSIANPCDEIMRSSKSDFDEAIKYFYNY